MALIVHELPSETEPPVSGEDKRLLHMTATNLHNSKGEGQVKEPEDGPANHFG